MKKILTSVFILACCMGDSFGANYCYPQDIADLRNSYSGWTFWISSNCERNNNTTSACYNNECSSSKQGSVDEPCSNAPALTARKNYLFDTTTQNLDEANKKIDVSCACALNTTNYLCSAGYYRAGDSIKYTSDTTKNCSTYSSGCEKCPDESMISAVGSTDISACKCPEKTYRSTNDKGNYICNTCPNGSNTTVTGATKLNDCKCPADQYMGKDNNGKDACLSCPTDTTSAVGSDDIDDCKCPQGFYMKADKKGCAPCPEYINTKDPGYDKDDPDSAKANTTTTSYGAKSIQECFIPQGTEFCDEKGCGTYTDNAGHN